MAVWDDAAASGIAALREAFEAAALLAELGLTAGDEAAAAAAPDVDVGARMLQHRPRLEAAAGPPSAAGP